MSTSIGKSFLDAFWKLADLNAEVRAKHICTIVDEIRAEMSDGAEGEKSRYAVQRLIKGLASSRAAARQGFATALVQILKEFPSIKSQEIIDLMNTHLVVKGALSNQESRDVFFGKIIGYYALVEAGRLKPTGKGTNEPDMIEESLKDLQKLATEKSFNVDICNETILQLCQQVPFAFFQRYLLTHFESALSLPMEKLNASQLTMVVGLYNSFSDQVITFNFEGSILSAKNLPLLTSGMKKSTYTHPKIHHLWQHLEKSLILESKKAKSEMEYDREIFERFWHHVEKTLLDGALDQRQFLLISLAQRFLQKVPAFSDIVLSGSLISLLRSGLSDKEGTLREVSVAFVETLIQVFGKLPQDYNRSHYVDILYKFMGKTTMLPTETQNKIRSLQGELNVEDGVTVMQGLISEFKTPSKSLRKQFEQADNKKTAANHFAAKQLAVLERMSFIVKGAFSKGDTTLASDFGKILIMNSFFDVNSDVSEDTKKWVVNSSYPLVDSVREDCHTRLLSLLQTVVTPATITHQVSTGHSITKNKGLEIFHELHSFAMLRQNQAGVILKAKLSKKQRSTLEQSLELLQKLGNAVKSTSETDVSLRNKFESFHIFTCALHFMIPYDSEDICETLTNVVEFADKTLFAVEKSSKEDASQSIKVFVDCLLSLLFKPSHFIRDIVNIVFSAFLDQIDHNGIRVCLDVFKLGAEKEFILSTDTSNSDKKSTKKDMQDDDEDDEDNDDDEDDEDDDEDDDDDDDDEDDDEDDEDDEDDDEDDEDDDDDGDDDGDGDGKQMEKLISKALSVASKKKDTDNDEDSEESLHDGDAELETYDRSLGEIMRLNVEKKNKAKLEKKAKQQFAQFRLRVLDLLASFAEKSTDYRTTLQIADYLLKCVIRIAKRNDQAQLTSKIVDVLTSFSKLKLAQPTSDDVARSQKLVGHSLKCMLSANRKDVNKVVSSILQFIFKAFLRGGKGDDVATILEPYGKAVEDYSKIKHQKFPVKAFFEFARYVPTVAKYILPKIGVCLVNAQKPFIRSSYVVAAWEVYQSCRQETSEAELTAILDGLRPGFMSFLEAINSQDSSMHSSVRNVLTSLNTLRKMLPPWARTYLFNAEMIAIIVSISEKKSNSKLGHMFNNLLAALQNDASTSKKEAGKKGTNTAPPKASESKPVQPQKQTPTKPAPSPRKEETAPITLDQNQNQSAAQAVDTNTTGDKGKRKGKQQTTTEPTPEPPQMQIDETAPTVAAESKPTSTATNSVTGASPIATKTRSKVGKTPIAASKTVNATTPAATPMTTTDVLPSSVTASAKKRKGDAIELATPVRRSTRAQK